MWSIAAVLTIFLAPTVANDQRHFTKAAPYTITAPDVNLDVHISSSITTSTSFNVGDRTLAEDFEITNNSEDTRDILDIYPFNLSLKPTPTALTPEQISTAIAVMEEIIINNLQFEADELTRIKAVDLKDVAVVEFLPAQERMLRNGRVLAGGPTAASSVMMVPGGIANVTFSLDYKTPSEEVLNEAVRTILNRSLKDALKNVTGFETLEEISATPYFPPPLIQPDDENGKRRTISVATSASLGAMAALIVAGGLGYYAWKKGSMKKMNGRFRDVRSSLRMNSLKRADPDPQAQEYLVEVCTDLTESPTTSPKVSPNGSSSYHSSLESPAVKDYPSPSSVRSKKLRAGDKKTIDPSEYVVEISTD
jgi:hypothetical protein